MGVDREPLHAASRRKLQKILLRAERARRSCRAPGGERRFTSLRAQLLPALPAGGAPRRGGRHLGLPHWFSLRRAHVRRLPPYSAPVAVIRIEKQPTQAAKSL